MFLGRDIFSERGNNLVVNIWKRSANVSSECSLDDIHMERIGVYFRSKGYVCVQGLCTPNTVNSLGPRAINMSAHIHNGILR